VPVGCTRFRRTARVPALLPVRAGGDATWLGGNLPAATDRLGGTSIMRDSSFAPCGYVVTRCERSVTCRSRLGSVVNRALTVAGPLTFFQITFHPQGEHNRDQQSPKLQLRLRTYSQPYPQFVNTCGRRCPHHAPQVCAHLVLLRGAAVSNVSAGSRPERVTASQTKTVGVPEYLCPHGRRCPIRAASDG
jgi:hypothetical protein